MSNKKRASIAFIFVFSLCIVSLFFPYYNKYEYCLDIKPIGWLRIYIPPSTMINKKNDQSINIKFFFSQIKLFPPNFMVGGNGSVESLVLFGIGYWLITIIDKKRNRIP